MPDAAEASNDRAAFRGGSTLNPADALAVQSLVTAYFQRTDRPGTGEVADLFTSDGVLILGNLEIVGRTAIATFFADRNRDQADAKRLTRHLTGGVDLCPAPPDRIIGYSTTAVFAGLGDLPLAVALPSSIADFDDVFVHTATGWLFEKRHATVIFTGPGAASFTR